MVSFVIAVLLVGLLIIVHEAGHYFAAVWGGMKVNRFSIGFGPVIYKSQLGETQFQLGALPLGGFVEVDGLAQTEGTPSDDPRSYRNRPFGARFFMVLAGPLANYLLAIVLLWAYFAVFNVAFTAIEVTRVQAGTAAADAGIEEGDLIVASPDFEVPNQRALLKAVRESKGRPLTVTLMRGESTRTATIAPRLVDGSYRLGIEFWPTGEQRRPLGIGEGFTSSLTFVWNQSVGILTILSKLWTSEAQLAGPVGIVAELSSGLERAPARVLMQTGLLSISLGLLNLLPIPALDGSRLLFLLVGAIRRRPVPPRLENTIHGLGLLLLLGLLVLVSIGDILRWING